MLKLFSFLIGILIVGAILYYVLEALSFSDVLDLISSIHLPTVIVFLVCSLSMALFRAWRYQILLSGSGFKPTIFPLLLVTFVRNLFADLLPAKMGTIVYVGLIHTKLKIPLPVAMSSWGYEYFLDIVALFPIVVLAALLVTSQLPASPFVISLFAIGAILISIIIVLVVPRILSSVHTGLESLSSKKFHKLAQHVTKLNSAVIDMRKGQIILPVVLLSLVIRILKYAGLYFLLVALLRPLGYMISDISAPSVFFGFISAEFAAAMPLPSIAGFGAYQGAWSYTFQLLGFSEHIAKLTSIAHHITTQAYAYGIGALAYLLLLFYRPSGNNLHQGVTSIGGFLSRFSLVCLALITALLVLTRAVSSSDNKNEEPTTVSVRQNDVLQSGDIVFDSQRGGTFGIHKIDGHTGEIYAIVDSPKEEMHPSLSVDREFVAFTQAESAHRLAVSDIWIKGSGEAPHLLVKDGSFPSFSLDGRTLYFQRNRRYVMQINLETKEESRIFPDEASEFNGRVVTIPRISPNGEWISFTSDYPSQWHTWAYNTKTKEKILVGKGCQPYWDPSGESLVFVKERDMKAGSGIVRFNLKTKASEVLLDSDGEHGHEYFPFISKRGNIMWGATNSNSHSHIDGGYQIFLKSGEITRQVTMDNFTNRWPYLVD